MTLKLSHNFSRNFSFWPISESEIVDHEQFEFKYGSSFHDSETTKFAVVFEVTVYLLEKGENFCLKIDYYSVFETQEEITDEFKDSNFVRINAPAIAFPFLRACIAQMTLMAGYRPLVLPSVNFVEKSKDPENTFKSSRLLLD